MKNKIAGLLLSAAILPTTVMAQSAQTAESAQAFLAQIAKNESAPAQVFVEKVRVPYTYKVWEDKFLRGRVLTKDENDERDTKILLKVSDLKASSESCSTALYPDHPAVASTSVNHRYNGEDMDWEWKYNFPRFGVIEIDWAKAKIRRGYWYIKGDSNEYGNAFYGNFSNADGVTAIFPDARYGFVSLQFKTSDADMLDRIEYAMKFLQMSCDPTSGTGF